MVGSLHSQLALVEEAFLSSVLQGPPAMEAFALHCSALQSSITQGIEQNDIDDETLSLVHVAFSRIEIMAGQLLDLHEKGDALTTSFQADLSILFADLNLDGQPSSPALSKTTLDPSTVLPPYIQPAHAWLLANLHNPYPLKEIRASIAHETNTSLKEVDNWFINIRKRIGWNKLRMKYYGNKRSKIVDAATRFFEEVSQTLCHDPYTRHKSGIDPTTNHDSEFQAIENRVKGLYSKKLLEASSVTNFDGAVRDFKPKVHIHAQEIGRQVAKSRRSKDLQRPFAYPSPEPSPERSSAASPLPVPDATLATNCKRRNCDRDSPELDSEDRCDGPQKRCRLGSYQISRDQAVASLPSPAASLCDIPQESSTTLSDQVPPENDCIILPTLPIPIVPSGKRKRRLSDAGHDGPSKRPHNALAVPRLQAVSDPLPMSNPIISEFHQVFGEATSYDIPGPVSVEPLDDTSVEVDLYNYNTSSDAIQPLWLANSSSGPYPAANSSSLGFLFENYLKDLDTPQAPTDMPFFPDVLCYDDSTLFSYENMLPTQPPQEDVLSDPYFQIPSLPWDFQVDRDSFSIIAPAGTLFSTDPVPPHTDATKKEAKLKQIEVLRAQLQDLEAEL